MEETVLTGAMDDRSDLLKLKNLRSLIKNIVVCHAKEISEDTEALLTNRHNFNIVKCVETVIAQKCFVGLDQASLDDVVKSLETSVKEVINSNILVKDQGIKELVPLCYEVLSLIFVSTNENFRQFFFHELIEYYYHELSENVRKLSPTTTVVLRENFDQQVKVFLPLVKLETALKFMSNEDSESQKLLEEILSNLTLFFKYSRLNQEDIYAIVNNKLNAKDYKLLSYELIPLDERNGHLGDYYKLQIHIKVENPKELIFFAKFLTPKLDIMKEVVCSGPSKKEEFFYMTYLPLLEKYGLKSLLDFSPKCYFSRVNDVIVLDNMVSLGFTALTPNIKLKYDGLIFVVKQIAKFHACGMIFEELLSKQEGHKVSLYEMYAEYFEEVIFNPRDTFLKESLEKALNIIHYLAEKFSELNKKFTHDEFIEKIDAEWNLMLKKISKTVKFKNTVCHGDMYVGNMLFKFDSNGACHAATLVDFQILRYCPPVQDLLFFIYQNSYKETRDKHFRELIDEYYLELSKHLETFNLNIANIYPKDKFEESLNYMKPQCVLQALFYSPFSTLDPKLREEIIQDKELMEKYFSGENNNAIDLGLEDDNYKRIMVGLMADLMALCEVGLL